MIRFPESESGPVIVDILPEMPTLTATYFVESVLPEIIKSLHQ